MVSALAPYVAIGAWAVLLWTVGWFGILAICERNDLDDAMRDDDDPC